MFTWKRTITIIVSVVLIGLVGWMISIRTKDSLAGLVPEHASWYIEIDKPIDVLKGIHKGVRLFADPNLTLFAEWQEELSLADQLFKREPLVYKYIKNTTLGISAHAITGKEAGYLFYINYPASEQSGVFALLKKAYGNSPQFRFEEREYLGKAIAEITFKKTGAVFSITGSDDALIGSFSGFLVEEVVRKSGVLFKPNFASRLRRDSRYAAFSFKPVRLFLQLRNAPDFLFHYLSPSLQSLRLSGNVGECMLLGFDRPDGMDWKSDGFVLKDPTAERSIRSQPLTPEMERYLPEPLVISFHYSVDDIWNAFPGKKQGLESSYELLKKALANELVIGLSEGEGLKKYNRILVTRIQDQALLDQFLLSVADVTKDAGIYKENYGGYQISQHSNPALSSILGGQVLNEWVPCFFARAGDILLVSDEVEMLRRSLDKTRKTNAPVPDRATISHHFSFVIHPSKAIPLLMESAAGPFKADFSEWIPLFKSMEILEMQDLGEEENPTVQLRMKWKISGTGMGTMKEVKRIFLDSTIITAPVRLESHRMDQPFWLVQDYKKQAHLLSPDLTVRFTLPMPERWISKPQILEGNPKGKESFSILYPMPNGILMSDEKGNTDQRFNLHLPDSQSTMDHVRVVDYDQSQQYRVFISSRYGPVFAADLGQKFLEGWNPWNNKTPLSFAPRHIRIGEKDLILLLDLTGRLMVTNRKAEMQPGFPLFLSGRIEQPLFIEPGLGLKNSYVYSLSELGLMEKVSLEGKAVSSIQLMRPEKETRFQLCPDQKQKTFSVARITGRKVTVFDQSYRPVFDFEAAGSQLQVQHFQFGASNKVYAVLDREKKTCYLLDETGNAISATPLEATQPIDIVRKPGTANQFLLISIFENRVTLLEFEKE